jgi:adenylate cyclase
MKRDVHIILFFLVFFASFGVLHAQAMDTTQRKVINSKINGLLEKAQYQEAHQFIASFFKKSTQKASNQDIAYLKYYEGFVYYKEEALDSAIVSLNAAIRIFEQKLNDDPDFAQQYTAMSATLLAGIHHEKYAYPIALDFYEKALKIYEMRQDDSKLASLLSDMSVFYRDIKNYNTALEYGTRALKMHQNRKDINYISYDLLNLAITHDELKNYDQALEFYFKVIETKTGDLTTTYNNIATSYKNKKQYDDALAFAKKALDNANANQEDYNLDLIEATFCEILFLKDKKDESLAHGLASLKYGRENENLDVIKAVSLILSEIYDSRGNKLKAYDMFKEHIAARDSINNEDKEHDVTRKIALYEFERGQQDKINEQLRKDTIASVEKKILYGGLTLMILLAALIFRNFRRERTAKAAIAVEQEKSEELLLNILPKHVAAELKASGMAQARSYEQVSVLFADFKDFTKVSEQVTPTELVALINKYFTQFDIIIGKYNLEKIKTIGDAYVCVGGLSDEDTKAAAIRLIYAAKEMQGFIEVTKNQALIENKTFFEQRIGISTGPVVAGIVGLKKFTYDIWGDTVNVAARMEQHSEVGKINISESTFQLVKSEVHCIHRGAIAAKNKGDINMYFVE